MREIKFRAWDDRDNSMWKFDLLETRTLGDIIALGFVMQYTGLKDKRQKEICEGDIVDLGDGAEVKWSQETGAWIVGDWLLCKKIVEIIGNVYENPELLEK